MAVFFSFRAALISSEPDGNLLVWFGSVSHNSSFFVEIDFIAIISYSDANSGYV